MGSDNGPWQWLLAVNIGLGIFEAETTPQTAAYLAS